MSRLRARDDRGATMVEMVVGMAIMAIFMAIFTTTMLMMSRSESKARSVADTANQVHLAFIWLDRHVRYASAISTPGAGSSGDWYVEWQTDTGSSLQCTQLRMNVVTQPAQLEYRSWTSGSSPAAKFTSIANGFTKLTTQPFTSSATQIGNQQNQQFQITLTAAGGASNSPSSTSSSFTFTAVNSSFPVPTGVCQEGTRS